jgi:hypothetical protein
VKRLKYHIAFLALLLGFTSANAQNDTLHFSFADGKGKRGVTYAYSLMLNDSLTVADSLFAGELTFGAGETVYDIVGIQKPGTLLAGVTDVQFNPITGKLTFANTVPITGKGIFIEFLITIRPNAYGSDPTTLTDILLNEGNITGLITDGSMRPMDIFISPKNPPQDRIVGDTIQFSVSGDVNFPVTWTVGDTHIVSIDADGRVIGKNVGQTTVTVTDNIGLTDQSLLLPIRPATLRSLTVTVPDMSVMQNLTFLLPVNVSTVTGLGITSAQFRLTYNPSVVTPLGIIKSGSLTNAWAEPTVLYGSNYLDVALAGAQAMTDSGAVVFVQFKMKRFANFSTSVDLSNVLFNENLNASVKNGIITPVPGPVISVMGKPGDMIPGETAAMTASGGTGPYRWKMLSDNAIASIDSMTGVLSAMQRGVAAFSATDANGFDRAESTMVTDIRFRFPDTTFIYTDSIDYPVYVSSTTGYSIVAAQLAFSYDTARITFVSVQRGGTVTNNMAMELKDSAGIRIALSGVTPLSGAGEFFRLRFRSKGLASINHTQPMFFSQTMLNESGASVRFASQRMGSLGITNVPNYPPVFTKKLRDTTITEGQMLQLQMAASDANNDSLTFGLFVGSPGMSLSPQGLFVWTPNFTQAGTHKAVFDVGDFHVNGVTRDSAVITVLNVDRAPQFTRLFPDTTIPEGMVFSFDVDAFDPDGTPVRFDLLNASAGMKIDSITGQFNWSPNFTQAGNHDVVIRVTDGTGKISVHEAFFTVTNANIPPMFTHFFNDTTIQEDQQLTFTLNAIDADGDIVHYYIQNIRPGMNIDTNTGVIGWRPTFAQSGVHNIAFVANDGKGGFANIPAVISVLNVNRPPVFTELPSDTVIIQSGNTVNAQLTAVDPDNDPLAFALAEGPAGVSVSQAGLLAWSPTAAQVGFHRVIVSVSDGSIAVMDTVYARVVSGNAPPVFVRTLPDTVIAEGDSLSFQYITLDEPGETHLWELQTDAAGLTLTQQGLLRWKPGFNDAGTFRIIVRTSDVQYTISDTAYLLVTNTNRSPFFTVNVRDTTIFVDSLYSVVISASDPDQDSLIYAFLKRPAGMLLSPSGTVQWRPTAVGRDTAVITVSDSAVTVTDSIFFTVTGFPALLSAAAELDFGTTVFGSRPVGTFTVRNTGRVPLILHRIPGLPNEQHFTSDVSVPLTIAPQTEKIISVTYTPQQIGAHTSGIAFTTNDPKRQYFGLLLKGTAISVSPVKRRLLVDLTHSPRIPLRDSIAGMTQLFSALNRSGIDVAFAETSFTPAGYDALLLVSPQKRFSEDERQRLRQFVAEGGLAVMAENATVEGNPFVLNELLSDTLQPSGMTILSAAVIDSANNYYGNPSAPMITSFADAKHPYLRGVDSLVFFRSAFILTDSAAAPFARATAPSLVPFVPGMTHSVIGLKKFGSGSIVVIGTTSLWQNAPTGEQQMPLNIAAKDNFTFALNLFSVDEDYALAMPSKTPNEVYQLISIPLELKDVDILSVLKANLGEINPLKWRLFGKFDPAADRYREFPSEGFTSFARGEAYWLITRGQFSLNFGSTTIVPAQDYFPIRIGPGYSMIGNPFPYPVSWKDSRIGDSVQTLLWRFDPSANKFAPESLSLAPFTGYFVKNLSQDSVTIYINPASVQPNKMGTEPKIAGREWRVRIGAASGKASDDENYAGVAAGARDELDRYDVGEPPTTPTDFVRVRFTNQQWSRHKGSYASDIRPENSEGLYWEFDVTAAKGQSKIRLELDQTGILPHGFGLYLVDNVTERVIRFDRSISYEFTMRKGETRQQFRLVAGKQEFVEKNTNGIPLIAMTHELRQNYPNPFNPSTFIHYTIGHSGTVQLDIYNVIGQKVRALRNELQQIGTYNIEWDGKDDAGETVASGVYFYKITITNNNEKLFSQTKKMVLMK